MMGGIRPFACLSRALTNSRMEREAQNWRDG